MHGAKCSKYHISAAVLLETISNILDLDLIHNIQIYRIVSVHFNVINSLFNLNLYLFL